MSAAIIRSCMSEIAGCIANNHALRAEAVFSSPSVNFAMRVCVSRHADVLQAEVGTAAGIGPTEVITGDAASLVEQVCAVLDQLPFGEGLRAEVSADGRDNAVIPIARISAGKPQFQTAPAGVLALIEAATRQAVIAVAGGASKEAALRVESPSNQWPVWVNICLSDGSFHAATNDVCLLTGCGPTFYKVSESGDEIVATVARFLSGEFLTSSEVSVLVRLDAGSLEGHSQNGITLAPQEFVDVPV